MVWSELLWAVPVRLVHPVKRTRWLSAIFAVETPVKKWPSVFPENSVFSRLPYLLPCLIAGSITFIG